MFCLRLPHSGLQARPGLHAGGRVRGGSAPSRLPLRSAASPSSSRAGASDSCQPVPAPAAQDPGLKSASPPTTWIDSALRVGLALIFSIRSLIESAARRVASGASPFAPVPSASLASRRAAGAARALAAKAALDAAGPTASPAALAAMTGCDDAAVSLETKWTGLLAAARDRLGSLYSAAARAAAAHDSAVAAAAGTDDGSAPLAFATPTSDSDGAVALAEADLYDHVFTQVLRGLKKQ